MTWSYAVALSTEKDMVRAIVGDTDTTDQLVSDELIAIYLSGGTLAQATVQLAAAEVATVISAKFARKVNSLSAGGTSVNWGDIAKRYRDLADQLRATDAANNSGGLFDIAEMVSPNDVFAYRERLNAEILRELA